MNCCAFRSLLATGLVFISLCGELVAQSPHVARGIRGMVVSVSPPATEAGIKILQQKGNAADAAIAVAFALQVTWPEAGNIGGGGFMMVHPGPGKDPVCIEYRETAPAASTSDMFQLTETIFSAKAAGVPGTLRGLELAHQRYGQLPWSELVAPAIQLAEEGFSIDRGLAESLNSILRKIDAGSSSKAVPQYAECQRLYQKSDRTPWVAGDRLVQPELAETLKQIAENGVDAFYSGPIAELIVAEMGRSQGVISLQDLHDYRAVVREPVHIRYRDFDIHAPPLPSSGGYCLAEMLQVLERYHLRDQPRWSATTVHLEIETMRRAFLDRALFLGDSDFVRVPEDLLTAAHADQLAKSIDPDKATPSTDLAPDLPIIDESPSTTHFSVMDGNGMAVSNTYTLEQSFGARVAVHGGGFLLNNEMGDFNWKAGHTDTRGRIGTKANLIVPGKRMLSSQTPVIVTREGQVVLVTGSPGGRTIINTVLNVLLNVLEFEMELPQAVAEPRLHHAWLPDRVQIEKAVKQTAPHLIAELQKQGHHVVLVSRQGDAHSICRNPQTGALQGVADSRRSGSAQGF